MATVINLTEVTKTTQTDEGILEEKREPVFVYIHCYNQACTRYHNLQSNLNFEQKVPGIRQETSFTYKDRGGDAPGVENSHVRFMVRGKDDNDRDVGIESRCSECGEIMNVSGTPSYKLMQYGVGPGTGLKGAERAAALAAAKVAEDNRAKDDEMNELKRQLGVQQKLLEKLLAQEEKKTTKTT